MIHQVAPRYEGRSGTRERKGWRAQRTYRREFQVLTDEDEDENTVMLADGIPRINSLHPTDLRAKCNRISCDIEDEKGIVGGIDVWKWIVKSEWTTEKQNDGNSPLWPETPAKISWGWDRKEIPIEKDREGKPVVNTAKDPYDPPLMIEFPIPIKTIQINLDESSYDPDYANTYFMAVNDSEFLGWEKDCVLVQDIQASSEVWTDEDDNDIKYWSVTVKLAFNALKWQPNILSQGLRELYEADDSSIKKRPIKINGRDATTPFPLDEDGHALTGDDVDDAKFDEYIVYNRKDLSVFDVE